MISQKLARADEVLARAVLGAQVESANHPRVERGAPAAQPRAQPGADLVAGSPWPADLAASQDAAGSRRQPGGALVKVQAAVDYAALSLFVVAVLGLPLTALGFVIGLV